MLAFVASICVCSAVTFLILFVVNRRKVYSIKGKHVMITGGSSGIGKCLAAAAVQRGASVVTLVARNKIKLNVAKRELEGLILKDAHQVVCVVSADIAEPAVIQRLAEAVKEMVPVDVLINCAGITHTATMADTPAHTYQDLWGVNVLGGVYATKAVLDSMIARKTGAIVFISSIAGQLGLYGYSAYSTTKFALRGLAETLQMELQPHNVRVSISFPPDTDTPQLQQEVKDRNALQSELASYGTVFQAEVVAQDVWQGVERGVFLITHGLDGFMLGNLNAGMSPVHSIWEAFTQVMLMGLFRFVGLGYLTQFNRVVARETAKQSKTN